VLSVEDVELDITERNILIFSVMTFNKLSLHQGPLKKCFALKVLLIFCK